MVLISNDTCLVYSVSCRLVGSDTVFMSSDTFAMPYITMEDFSRYWLKSYSKKVIAESKGENCRILFNCSNGQSKSFVKKPTGDFGELLTAQNENTESPKVEETPVESKPVDDDPDGKEAKKMLNRIKKGKSQKKDRDVVTDSTDVETKPQETKTKKSKPKASNPKTESSPKAK